jgi:hypothetical protein
LMMNATEANGIGRVVISRLNKTSCNDHGLKIGK